MNKAELKKNLHQLIDKLEDVQLLKEYYRELKKMVANSKGAVWETLSEKEKKEVLVSFEESEDDNILTDHEEVMKQYKKWL